MKKLLKFSQYRQLLQLHSAVVQKIGPVPVRTVPELQQVLELTTPEKVQQLLCAIFLHLQEKHARLQKNNL